jgi:hypothetical protein
MNWTRVLRPSASVLDEAWANDRAWAARLASDRVTADQHQTRAQREITETLLRRARETGAEAFALTGSTARDRRTEISDLDYHVIGPRPRHDDLSDEVDIYAGDANHFWTKLRAGDDFVQWTLRFGCILFDSGIFRAGLKAITVEQLWPGTRAKWARLPELQRLAMRLIKMGDRDAAQDQVRAALTSAARVLLLEAGVFPLARGELPHQLRAIGHAELADALNAMIHTEPSLPDLGRHLAALEAVSAAAGHA